MLRLSLFALLISPNVYSKDLQFEKLWNQIQTNSNAINGAEESVKATATNLQRQNRHWYPTVYLQGQSYISNDPGANLFGLMSMRKIEQIDFSPSKINEPGSNQFTKGAIGVNLPLYEGGMKSSIAKASQFQLEAKKFEYEKTRTEFYSEVAQNYFSLYVLKNQKNELIKVSNHIDSILSRYQIGSKSNPVGYSGLLGLKSLKNRLKAFQDENSAKLIAYESGINELSGNKEALVFLENKKLSDLLNEYLSLLDVGYKESAKVKTFYANAQSASEIIGAEKSRNLPRVGVFAESYAFNGKRDTATAFSTGIYLNWNLFSGNDLNASDEAMHNYNAATYYAKAIAEKEKIEFSANQTMEATLKTSLVTLDESQKLLDEQMNVANNLFKNGMINALQLVEVLSRRVDLINSKTDVELKLVETKAKSLNLSNELPQILK